VQSTSYGSVLVQCCKDLSDRVKTTSMLDAARFGWDVGRELQWSSRLPCGLSPIQARSPPDKARILDCVGNAKVNNFLHFSVSISLQKTYRYKFKCLLLKI
jgi:hypothetical protein